MGQKLSLGWAEAAKSFEYNITWKSKLIIERNCLITALKGNDNS